MRKLPAIGVIAALTMFVTDQAIKFWVTTSMQLNYLGASREIVSVFDLRFVHNCGISLGLLQADDAPTRWALVVLTSLIAVGVVVWMTRENHKVDQFALGLVVGGALGNIADRVVPAGILGKVADTRVVYPGCVIDFADLHFGTWRPFLVFNVADAAITIGVLVLLVRALLIRDKPRTDSSDKQGAGAAPVENSNA